jgi:hypothetical protein
MTPATLRRLAPLLAWSALALGSPARAEDDTRFSLAGEVRLAREFQTASTTGAWADARARWPNRVAAPRHRSGAQLQLRADARRRLDTSTTLGLHADAQTALQRDDGDANPATPGRVNELYAHIDHADWQFAAGRRIVAWDVGYAFRPNDVVQREERRPLLPTTPQGRAVLQAEQFDADSATSVVAVEPQGDAATRRLALRHFRRLGALDGYLHADWQRDSHAGVGAALAWVASDAVELHASTRWQPHLSRHQTLAGLSWTGGPDVTLLAEAWHDGAATPIAARRNLYLRASRKLDAWEGSLDLQWQPDDGGRSVGASLRWQGDRWRLDAAWRLLAGPHDAAMRQGPLRHSGAVAATRAF